jgi:hypothetical protein
VSLLGKRVVRHWLRHTTGRPTHSGRVIRNASSPTSVLTGERI